MDSTLDGYLAQQLIHIYMDCIGITDDNHPEDVYSVYGQQLGQLLLDNGYQLPIVTPVTGRYAHRVRQDVQRETDRILQEIQSDTEVMSPDRRHIYNEILKIISDFRDTTSRLSIPPTTDQMEEPVAGPSSQNSSTVTIGDNVEVAADNQFLNSSDSDISDEPIDIVVVAAHGLVEQLSDVSSDSLHISSDSDQMVPNP
ncbi:uncharacterized protein LOC128958491 [Oppia nitens]|uniref:uncharacterized protein LOC128958491 n=1 Tax=Oppia nitens TaxID=1686743 RepID=UPI0023DB4F14|nr:uncharacterized protein LOC128958491 [Oppia nitens]